MVVSTKKTNKTELALALGNLTFLRGCLEIGRRESVKIPITDTMMRTIDEDIDILHRAVYIGVDEES